MTSLGTWAPSQDISSFGSLAVTQILHLALTMHLFASSLQLENKRGEPQPTAPLCFWIRDHAASAQAQALNKRNQRASLSHLSITKNPTLGLFSIVWKNFLCKVTIARVRPPEYVTKFKTQLSNCRTATKKTCGPESNPKGRWRLRVSLYC